MERIAVIPARFASRRFRGKLMADLVGMPVILHTLNRVSNAKMLDKIVVATDSDSIEEAVRRQYAQDEVHIVRSPSSLECGTARVAYVVDKMWNRGTSGLKNMLVLNIQGDQPNLDPSHVDILLDLASKQCDSNTVSTLCTPIRCTEDYNNPSVVKCVTDNLGFAMYFSRATVPFRRDGMPADGRILAFPDEIASSSDSQYDGTALRHLGIYAFRGDCLVEKIAKMSSCAIEELEKLEQLRWMYNGVRVCVGTVSHACHSVDTQSDLDRARADLSKGSCN